MSGPFPNDGVPPGDTRVAGISFTPTVGVIPTCPPRYAKNNCKSPVTPEMWNWLLANVAHLIDYCGEPLDCTSHEALLRAVQCINPTTPGAECPFNSSDVAELRWGREPNCLLYANDTLPYNALPVVPSLSAAKFFDGNHLQAQAAVYNLPAGDCSSLLAIKFTAPKKVRRVKVWPTTDYGYSLPATIVDASYYPGVPYHHSGIYVAASEAQVPWTLVPSSISHPAPYNSNPVEWIATAPVLSQLLGIKVNWAGDYAYVGYPVTISEIEIEYEC